MTRPVILDAAGQSTRMRAPSAMAGAGSATAPPPCALGPTTVPSATGKEPVEYLHPSMEPILRESYGVMTYQDDGKASIHAVRVSETGHPLGHGIQDFAGNHITLQNLRHSA